jgi:SAM-dependent methyltransferase
MSVSIVEPCPFNTHVTNVKCQGTGGTGSICACGTASDDAYGGSRYLDMNRIPSDLEGFDFVWSLGSLEHLGSLDNSNRFILESLRCLRPGGIAVHTTEYSIYPEAAVTVGGTIYHDRHEEILKLAEEVGRQGHRMECDDFALGSHPVDYWMDFPPYYTGPNIHLRLFANNVLATSYGIIIHKETASPPA